MKGAGMLIKMFGRDVLPAYWLNPLRLRPDPGARNYEPGPVSRKLPSLFGAIYFKFIPYSKVMHSVLFILARKPARLVQLP